MACGTRVGYSCVATAVLRLRASRSRARGGAGRRLAPWADTSSHRPCQGGSGSTVSR